MTKKQEFLNATPHTTNYKLVVELLRHSSYTKLLAVKRALNELDKIAYTSDLKNLSLLDLQACVLSALSIETTDREESNNTNAG